ncbi:MAG TPA: MBL fold metallo-hydrolase [Burkholderiaceae bacterium]|nr:MBL fold metallo-hydrolase [Burkholderiaceae bacterium]
MRIAFHGADRTVTGSCHLIECAGVRVLIDCGLAQGGHEMEERNRAAFGFAPADIDFVLLTHAHLDHCGRLPLLAKRGFRGEIVSTAATRELARVVMLDAAHLQEEEARRDLRRKPHRRTSPAEPAFETEPLYSVLDALNCLDRFGRVADYGKSMDLAPGVRVTFFDAGHILGSASLYLELQEGDRRQTVAFTGDLGNRGRPLLRSPVVPPASHIAVMETTYGDRRHKPIGPSIDEFFDAIAGAFARGGNVVIPTFALERAQEVLWYLRQGREQGRLPALMQVFLDSPMAISATQIFEHHPECFEPQVARQFGAGRDPFALPGLHFTRDATESMAINRFRSGAVILAGAGMCNGGRVRHHLRQNLWRESCAIVFVGYAARGTLARRIIDGAKSVHIFEEEIRVRASIHTINGFSAHADRDELLDWHTQIRPARTFLVHGEEDVMQAFAALLHDTRVEMPEFGQSCEL